MPVIQVSEEVNKLRERFFRTVFGEGTGYICVASLDDASKYEETYFEYPVHLDLLLEYVNRQYHGRNLYFCPQLLREQKRTKVTVKECRVLWADLDACPPDVIDPKPSISVESSPGRFQAYWVLTGPTDPFDAEDGSHRIAHMYQTQGADQSGWDLTQLLRVPITYNLKYESMQNIPVVMIKEFTSVRFPIERFQQLPEVPGYEYIDTPLPDSVYKIDPDDVLMRNRDKLDPQVAVLYSTEPKQDWSSALWNLEMLLIEAGVSKEEAFAVCFAAKCNKFGRDGRNPIYLWKDINRAATKIEARIAIPTQGMQLSPLLTPEERNELRKLPDDFVERFTTWAKTRGDAASQYFEAGAFTILSSLLSGVVQLPTSFGVMIPNLWFMILADTTLTRKSTAMDMAMEMLLQVEPDSVLATDGSIEGLMTSIASRPGRPGIFWRDEFSGLLAAIKQKDYLAGMVEALTKLYDGKYQKRILRKETVEIKDPILLIFAGGIRTKILELMDHEHVVSGFAPRFIFIEAESDIANYKPMGPMTEDQDNTRDVLVKEVQALRDRYVSEMTIRVEKQEVKMPKQYKAVLDTASWDRYNKLEREMLQVGVESGAPEIFTPTLDRLSKSALKCAVLLAAARQTPDGDKVHVEIQDILKSISYVERWREWSIDVASNVGKTMTERKIDMILQAIQKNNGISRSRVMQNYHLTSREADWLLETLDQRGLIRRIKDGKGERLHPATIR